MVFRADSWHPQYLQLLQRMALRPLKWIRSSALLLWKLLEASWVFLLLFRQLLRLPPSQCFPSVTQTQTLHTAPPSSAPSLLNSAVPSLFTLDSCSWGQQSFGKFLRAGFISWAPDLGCWALTNTPLLPLSVYLIHPLMCERSQFKF